MAMFPGQLAFRTIRVDEAARKVASHVLHLDASHGPSSVIAQGANAFFAEFGKACPGLQVQHLRLWDAGTREQMEYGLEHVQAKMAMLGGTGGEAEEKRFSKIEQLAWQLASARGIVVSAPMWNYSVPYVVKQYFDCVLHPGLTFRELPNGATEGLLGCGRPLVVLTSSGGSAARDHLTPWLRDVAAMAGFDQPSVVAAPNVAHGERQAVIDGISSEAVNAARRFAVLAMSPAESSPAAPAGMSDLASRGMGEDEDDSALEWDEEGVLGWLRSQSDLPLSEDALESVKAMRINSGDFRQATEADWQSDELGLEDDDIAKLVELQRRFCSRIGAVGLGP